MISKYILASAIMIRIFYISGCSSSKNTGEKYFTVKDMYYQSWMINNNEKGTDIIVELTGIKSGVGFDSIIFRGIKLPVFSEEKGDNTVLKSILYNELDISLMKQEISELPDQLIYHYHKSKYYLKLDSIRRLNIRYY
jgi:hypothetical protein